jgi:titin
VIGLTLENEQRTMFLGVEVVEEAFERPSPVRDVKVSSTARGAISLSWMVPVDDGGSAITQYRIRVRTMGDSAYRTVGRTTSLVAVVSGLKPGARYIVRVRAVNEVGASRSHDRLWVRVAKGS